MNPFDSRQLLTLVTLARTRSFTEAAKELHLTQSAVSHSVKALEKETGQTLFERSGRYIKPTPVGEYLIREAAEILARMEGIRSRLSDVDGWGRGRLRVGASPACCHLLLPEVLREFKQSFPGCSILVRSDREALNLERLRGGEVDLVLSVALEREPVEVAACDWFTDRLEIVLPVFHPLAARRQLKIIDLEGETLHLYGNESRTDKVVLDALRSQGVRAAEILEVGSIDAVKEMVKIGQGVAFMARWAVQKELDEGSLVMRPVNGHTIERLWKIYWARQHQLTLFEETFVGLCLEALEGSVLAGQPG
ncbi:LysR family transcriptional regulator [Ruficoccus amylovorans]|uniref:LysR family transcriptional regulator n=1 Tax=Ruficoccus amylovorans TaxID=1804625 RepID=A0A842HIP8_9BACT|nr:LysR family transcriptional regulator [Ruficoccus amylovorans]MBC2595466.1 LysR family transcriptional regulator [Ruficoccus amylovorans]